MRYARTGLFPAKNATLNIGAVLGSTAVRRAVMVSFTSAYGVTMGTKIVKVDSNASRSCLSLTQIRPFMAGWRASIATVVAARSLFRYGMLINWYSASVDRRLRNVTEPISSPEHGAISVVVAVVVGEEVGVDDPVVVGDVVGVEVAELVAVEVGLVVVVAVLLPVVVGVLLSDVDDVVVTVEVDADVSVDVPVVVGDEVAEVVMVVVMVLYGSDSDTTRIRYPSSPVDTVNVCDSIAASMVSVTACTCW
jgi:hypothetical protein